MLTELRKAIDEKLEDCELFEIRLSSVANKRLVDELNKIIPNDRIKHITQLYGIPVVVDNAVPEDKAWILKKMEGK